jgi:hypothetical protein
MKRLALVLASLSFLTVSAFAQNGPRSLGGRGDAADRPQAQLQNRIADFYLVNFKEEVGLSNDQLLRVGPKIRRFILNRFQAANQRRILEERQDQLLSQPDASDADLQKLNQDIANLEDASIIDRRFLKNLEPELSERQLALARQFHKRFISEKLPMILEQLREERAAARGRPGGRPNQQNRRDTAPPPATLRDNPDNPARKFLSR